MGKELNGKTQKLLFVSTRHDDLKTCQKGYMDRQTETPSGGLSEDVLHSLDI